MYTKKPPVIAGGAGQTGRLAKLPDEFIKA